MISNIDQRVFKYTAAGTIWTDLTKALNDPTNAKTAAVSMAPADFLYISAFLPFNHKYFQFETPSTDDIMPKIEVCSGANEWSVVADVLDYTESMAEDGILQWTPDNNQTWGRVSNNRTDVAAFAGAPIVYDMYWLRISFPGGASEFTLKYIGYLFSTDRDLFLQYPVLQNSDILDGYETAKSDWTDQHILAANYIVKELINRNLVLSADQILDTANFQSAAVHRTANMIYSGLGAKNYEAEIKLSAANFDKAMTQNRFGLDSNMNARKDIADRLTTTTRATR